ncbi:hypothetical protein LEP1GSC050_0015 [Leptospira phage vB_LbrZ_5399-LE1]|nr:hypothetical protein LEP1GSC050_0015 [Leptospira phage vB_LbrZ_5399-LE1]
MSDDSKNSMSESSSRLKECLLCEHLKESIKYAEQCRVCNCFVRLKTKIQSQSCPKGKW